MTGVALALAVFLTAKPPPRPTAASVMKDCAVWGPAFGIDRFIKCKTFTVEVYTPVPAAIEKAVLSEQARINTTSQDGKEILTMADVTVAGKKRKAFRYLKKKFDGSSDVGLVTTVPAGNGQIRLVHCWKGMEFGCFDIFELVMKTLPEPTGAAAAGGPAVNGRVLTIPKGCSRKGPSQIACGDTELLWSSLYPGAPETLDEVDLMMRRATQHLGDVEATDKFCLVEKTEAMCRVATITARNKQQTKSYLVYGFASTQGNRLWFSCSTSADPNQGLPSPCDQVMAFKAPE